MDSCLNLILQVAIKIVDKKMMADKAKKSKDAHEERERRMKGKERKEDHTQDKRGGPQSGSKKETVSSHHNQSDPDSSMVGTQFRQESSVGHETMAPDSQIPQTEREPQPDFVSKLQPEVQLMLRLDHPHIVKVFQVIDTEDECFIVM